MRSTAANHVVAKRPSSTPTVAPAARMRAIFALAERVPVEWGGRGRRGLARALGLHAAFAAGVAVADVAVDHVFTLATLGVMPEAYRPLGARFFGEAFINFYSYALVLGVG